jgi:hypothetical protein
LDDLERNRAVNIVGSPEQLQAEASQIMLKAWDGMYTI